MRPDMRTNSEISDNKQLQRARVLAILRSKIRTINRVALVMNIKQAITNVSLHSPSCPGSQNEDEASL